MEQTDTQFNIGQLLPIGLTIVVLGIALSYGLSVMGDIKTDMSTGSYVTNGCGQNTTFGTSGTLVYTNCSAEYNATVDAVTGVAKIPNKLPMIVTVIVAAVIIGIIVRYLMFR